MTRWLTLRVALVDGAKANEPTKSLGQAIKQFQGDVDGLKRRLRRHWRPRTADSRRRRGDFT